MREIVEQSAQLRLFNFILEQHGWKKRLLAHANNWELFMYPKDLIPELGLHIAIPRSEDFERLLSDAISFFYKHLNEFERATEEPDHED